MKSIDYYCYGNDVKNFWKNPREHDPDFESVKLQKHLQLLYNHKYLNGLLSDDNDYLSKDDMRFGCDSLANILKINELSIDEIYYWTLINTIGGKIIFPKDGKYSINRIKNNRFQERMDFLLECIRGYYNNEENRLTDIIEKSEINKNFFNLFKNSEGKKGFENYVKFFFLDDLVTDNYNKIKFFIDDIKAQNNLLNFNNPIPHRPQDDKKFLELFTNIMQFVVKRNERILKYCRDNRINLV